MLRAIFRHAVQPAGDRLQICVQPCLVQRLQLAGMLSFDRIGNLQQPVVLIFIDSDHGGNKAGALFFHQISLCQKSQFFFGKRVIAPQQPKQQPGGGSSWPVDCAPR